MTGSGDEDRATETSRGIDGISCAGLLLFVMLVLSVMGTVFGSSALQARNTDQSVPTEEATPTRIVFTQALLQLTPTLRPTDVPSPTPTDTATSTPTPTVTPTLAPTETETTTPTEVYPSPTNTPQIPTATPTSTPTATPEPLPTPRDHMTRTLKVPILMYHYISVPPEDADEYRVGLSVAPDHFRQQMQYLAENDYHAIDLYELSLAITNQRELPSRPVIITIDDGYRDNYENAFPILREFGLTATIFLATGFIDQGNESYLSWDMVNEMRAAGIRFEPHSKSHLDMRNRDRDFLIYEILGSMETLAAHIGYQPRYFAYPSGRYDEAVIQVLRELGFWGAVTTYGGKWHGFNERYEWTRLRVRNNTPLLEFIDLVDPGDTVNGRPSGAG